MSMVNPGMRLRLGTWNLERSEPRWRLQRQATHISNEADLWLLTHVPSYLHVDTEKPSFSGLRPGETNQCWAAITFKWPMQYVPSRHPSLVMARISHPGGDFLAASSVFPWRTAMSWPFGEGVSFPRRCAQTLAAHAKEIGRASAGLSIVWGGNFNQALTGRERVGSDVGRGALLEAFETLGLRAVTGEANGQDPRQRSIDHIAIPSTWSSRVVRVQRPKSDNRLLSNHPAYVVSVERAAVASTVPGRPWGSLQLSPHRPERLIQI
jgi:hypothetical protein